MFTTCEVDCPAKYVALLAEPVNAVELIVALVVVLPIKMLAELIVTFDVEPFATETFEVEIPTFEPTLICGVRSIGVVTLWPIICVLVELLPTVIVVELAKNPLATPIVPTV